MRLPYISIEYREEETYAIGKTSPWLVIGFALQTTWIFIALLKGDALIGLTFDMSHHLLVLCFTIPFSLTLILYGVFLEKARSLFDSMAKRRRNRLIATVTTVMGVGLVALSGGCSIGSVALVISGGMLSGFGVAVLMMSFSVSFCVCDMSTAAVTAALSFSLSMFMYALFVYVDGILPIITMIYCFAAPPLTLVCLNRCSSQLVDRMQFTMITLPVKIPSFAGHVVSPCFVFGLLIGYLRILLVSSLSSVSPVSQVPIITIAGCLLTIFVTMGVIVSGREGNNLLPRTLMPVVALLMSGLVFLGGSSWYVAFAFLCSYMLAAIALWVTLSDISQRFRISVFTVFGLGYGASAAGGTITYLGVMVLDVTEAIFTDWGRLVAVTFVLVVLGTSLLPKTAELRRTLKLGSTCPAFMVDDIAMDMVRNQVPPMEKAVEKTGDTVLALNDRSNEGDLFPDDDRSPAEIADEGREHAREPVRGFDVPMTNGAPAHDADSSLQAEVGERHGEPDITGEREAGVDCTHHPDDPGSLQIVGDSASSDDAQMVVDELLELVSEEAEIRQRGRFKRKCMVVANTYLLSRKETEVLFLLAKGRNAAAIQEILYIAAGTANTHMRHIYRKLDVHSQQELIELVESTEIGDWDD